MKMYEVLDLQVLYNSIANVKLPLKTTYKFTRLMKRTEEEINFYQEKFREIVEEYGVKENLIETEDKVWAVNRILEILNMDSMETDAEVKDADLEEILKVILDYAVEKGLCEDSIVYKDLFDTKVMGVLTPRPSEVIKTFKEKYAVSPEEATDYYYHLARKSDYIREYRIKNDVKWVTSTEYGDIDITINLAKPEKDPKAIAAATKMEQSSYPKCMLCKENEGYAGRVNHPARQNHRVIPICLDGVNAFLQYSPYVYYNEHCIVYNGEHIPMKVDVTTLRKIIEFVTIFIVNFFCWHFECVYCNIIAFNCHFSSLNSG